MEGKIQAAKEYHRAITVRRNSSMARYFQDEMEAEQDQGISSVHTLRIQDPNHLILKMKGELNKEGKEVLDSISMAQKMDDNAIYYYLKAYSDSKKIYHLLNEIAERCQPEQHKSLGLRKKMEERYAEACRREQ